jgi:hypothetical protein
VSVGV